jgi:hypothetical protein
LVIGLPAAYEYPLSTCGFVMSSIGSTERNMPMLGSYWRAPTIVRPVVLSVGLPRNPFVSGHAVGGVPRAAPYGVDWRHAGPVRSADSVSTPVPWWSVSS